MVSLTDFPDDLAMYFIINGARSYVNVLEGLDEFYKGLKEIREGREYVAPEVKKRIDMRGVYPEPTGILTDRQREIIRLAANGFTVEEIAATLGISVRSVGSRKAEIYTAMNVRNGYEAIRAAIYLGIIKPDELYFFGGDYELKPLPDKREKRKMKNGGKNDYQN